MTSCLALALTLAQPAGGDSAAGGRLFAGPRAACATCHSVDGRGGKPGPDLLGVADKFDRAGLLRAVVDPSADILPGYETTVVTTVSGVRHTGILRRVDATAVQLLGADGALVRVPLAEVEERTTSRVSLMPAGLTAGWTPAEVDDLLAYLGTLKAPAVAARPDSPTTIPRAARPAVLRPVVPASVGLHRPVWYGPLPGHPGQFLAVEVERARVWRLEGTGAATRRHPFVDLHAHTRHGYIEGILGFALHPDFARNRRYFLAMHDPARDRVVVDVWERTAAADGLADSGAAPRKLLAVPMPHVNHNGCCLESGPDGKLYISFGDGGPQEDPDGHSQNLGSLLGKLLRLDVDGPDTPYTVPADNPFVKATDARPEVWALGFREPWRFSFDRRTGDLWVGDVGQGRFEEVCRVRAGENHGWNVFEGFTRFSDRHRRAGETYVSPVLSYSHRHGVSVTGGYVYRGGRAPALAGTYVFGDFETRKVWGLTAADGKLASLVELARCPSRIAAFGQDEAGELYVVGHDPHVVYHLDLSAADPTPVTPRELAPTAEAAGVLWRHTLAAPPAGWERPGFDDRGWAEAPAGFGTRDVPGAVPRTDWRTADIWLRREFTLAAAPTGEVALRLYHEEDSEIYLNGVPAARTRGWTTGYIELPLSPEAVRALTPGRNLIAVHCHQISGGQYIDAGLVEYRSAAGVR